MYAAKQWLSEEIIWIILYCHQLDFCTSFSYLRKLSHLDISGVNNPESIPHGQRICLHPDFDPQDENDPVKADIGLFILEEPIYGDDIPLSKSPNITLKSCSKCQYRSCDVYEYQSKLKDSS